MTGPVISLNSQDIQMKKQFSTPTTSTYSRHHQPGYPPDQTMPTVAPSVHHQFNTLPGNRPSYANPLPPFQMPYPPPHPDWVRKQYSFQPSELWFCVEGVSC